MHGEKSIHHINTKSVDRMIKVWYTYIIKEKEIAKYDEQG